MYLSGNYYSVEEKSDVDYDLYNEELNKELNEELNESAKEEAMSDIEEEYDSDTVSDYMNYGVQEKKVKKALDPYTICVVYLGMMLILKLLF